jgi:hypothetical protein
MLEMGRKATMLGVCRLATRRSGWRVVVGFITSAEAVKACVSTRANVFARGAQA